MPARGSDDQPTMGFMFPPNVQALETRYEILGEAGSGGMGIVYRARDRETGAIVAVKILHPEVAARPELIERFKTELLLARKITHKNVCRVYDLGRYDNVVAISMEFVEGESLRSLLNRVDGLSIRHGLKIIRQVISGLAEAHTQGIVHRDLKPENIVIANDGIVKVMDFGIARSVDTGATNTGTILGTPLYMAPEQAEGKPADNRADIYSLGMILYECFTGRPAFTADTPFAVAFKQIHQEPIRPREVEPSIPAHIETAILRCLEKNPAKRYPTVGELDAALSNTVTVQPMDQVKASDVALPIHLTHWMSSDWILVLLAIAALALFFPSFNRTSLAPHNKVSFDRNALLRMTQDYAQRAGATLGGEVDIRVHSDPATFDYLSQSAGASTALELANNPIPFQEWCSTWAGTPGQDNAVCVNNQGALTSLARAFPANFTAEKLSIEEARPIAEKAIRDFFKRDPSLLQASNAATSTYSGQPAVSFTWTDSRDYYGVKERYTASLVGREIRTLENYYQVPAGFVWDPSRPLNPPLAPFVLAMLILGVYRRKSVDLSSRWRTIMLCWAFVSGFWLVVLLIRNGIFPRWMPTAFAFGVFFVMLWFFLFVTIERAIVNQSRARFISFVHLFARTAASAACGLAIFRGTLFGLALLGADTFLVWLGTSQLGMTLNGRVNAWLLNPEWPGVSPALNALMHLFGGFLIAFAASVALQFTRRSPLAVLITAALFALSGLHLNMAAVEPWRLQIPLLFIDFLIFAWAFVSFDLLTLLVSAFTFVFCWVNYSMLVMLEPSGSIVPLIAFAVWGFVVALALASVFKSSLASAWRRIGVAFE